MTNKDKIRIAVDSNIIIALSKFDNPMFDVNNSVHTLLAKNACYPNVFTSVPKDNLPLLLQDNFLGHIQEVKGVPFYSNLLNIAKLYELINDEGGIELCATPTVLFECNFPSNMDFINKYVTILKVDEKDSVEFFSKRMELAQEYCNNGVMEKERDAVYFRERVSADSCIMAEASLFGLNLITANEKHYVHSNPKKKDFLISSGIESLNRNYGLIFMKTDGSCASPTSASLSNFIIHYKKILKNNKDLNLEFLNPNINEDNEYLPK